MCIFCLFQYHKSSLCIGNTHTHSYARYLHTKFCMLLFCRRSRSQFWGARARFVVRGADCKFIIAKYYCEIASKNAISKSYSPTEGKVSGSGTMRWRYKKKWAGSAWLGLFYAVAVWTVCTLHVHRIAPEVVCLFRVLETVYLIEILSYVCLWVCVLLVSPCLRYCEKLNFWKAKRRTAERE